MYIVNQERGGKMIEREGLDNDAAIEGDAVLMAMQERIDLQVLGYYDFHNDLAAALPANHDYICLLYTSPSPRDS